MAVIVLKRKHTFATCCLLLLLGYIAFHRWSPVPLTVYVDPRPSREDQADIIALHQIQSLCGPLCDLTKPVERRPGDFLGTVRAKTDCAALFSSPVLDQASRVPPKNWTSLPHELQNYYDHGGSVSILNYFLNNAPDGGQMVGTTEFSEADVNLAVERWKARTHSQPYYQGAELVDGAAAEVGIEGKTVLVIGSQTPWLEAVLLARKPSKVLTVEYGSFHSSHPAWEILRPEELRRRYLANTLGRFDLVFTYSSVEHSGLGRYGDALNPFGDIITIARSWCVSTPQAKLVIGVPTDVQRVGGGPGGDRIEYNAHRVYGPRLYPYLTTNWRFVWPTDNKAREGNGGASYQPVFIFEKIPE